MFSRAARETDPFGRTAVTMVFLFDRKIG